MDTGSSGCGVSERYSAIKLVVNGIIVLLAPIWVHYAYKSYHKKTGCCFSFKLVPLLAKGWPLRIVSNSPTSELADDSKVLESDCGKTCLMR